MYFDLFERPPGPVTTDQSTLAEVLISGKYDSPASDTARAAFLREFCQFDDGHAAERVVRAFMLGQPLLPVTPLAERTRPPRPDEVRLRAAIGSVASTWRSRRPHLGDLPTDVGAPDVDAASGVEGSEIEVLEVLEPEPGLALAELAPTEAEDRAAVSWKHSGDPSAEYEPVPVTVDPERTAWHEVGRQLRLTAPGRYRGRPAHRSPAFPIR